MSRRQAVVITGLWEALKTVMLVGLVLLAVIGLLSRIPIAFWERLDGVSPAGSEAHDAAPVVESPRTPGTPAWAGPGSLQLAPRLGALRQRLLRPGLRREDSRDGRDWRKWRT